MSNSNPSPKRRFYGVNIGSASMLLIFVILCLVSFAALSIVSANADFKLSSKIAERTQNYYTACGSAEETLADMDRNLALQYAASENEEAYFASVGHSSSYAIPISDTQTLSVEIEILYPASPEDTFYRITAWQVINH